MPEKCNESCIKMFKFIQKLYLEEVDFKWVIELFSNGKYDGTSNTHVTLNKYLNALKIFGVKIKKVKGKYRMLSSLYTIKFSLNDVKSINLLKNACKTLPAGKNKSECEKFIKALEIRYDENAQCLTQIENNTENLHLSFYHSEIIEQVKKCEQYCQDKQKLEIIYTDDKGNNINLLASPVETIYQKRRIYLRVVGNNGSRIYDVPVENILSIVQIPSAINRNSMPTTIVFRIKNRLAKNYRLRDWEKLQTIETDGSKIIVNKNEDFELLLNRLMRYGKECEVISPKFMKDEMVNIINKTLSNYQ